MAQDEDRKTAVRTVHVQEVHDRLEKARPPDLTARRPKLKKVTEDALNDTVVGQAVYIRNLENAVYHWESVANGALNLVVDLEAEVARRGAEVENANGVVTRLADKLAERAAEIKSLDERVVELINASPPNKKRKTQRLPRGH